VPIASSPLRLTICRLAAATFLVAAPVGASAQGSGTSSDSTAPKKPFASLSASASAIRDSIVALARAQIGFRYVRGGQTPERGFDCSGLVRYLMSALSVQLPRTAREQARVGTAVPKDREHMRPGDLLTFGKGSRIAHIGIYLGDGRFVHASTSKGRVIESSLDRKGSSLIRKWSGVRRLQLAQADSSGAAEH
jgi:cell wall-associated NlpC family hydrolase